MRFLDPDGPIRCVTVLKHEKITKKRLWAVPDRRVPGRPSRGQGRCPWLPRFRLLKLLPKEGPTCDFASIAATNVCSLTTRRSHSFGGPEEARKFNGLFSEDIYRSDMPARAMSSVKRSMKSVHLGAAGHCAAQTPGRPCHSSPAFAVGWIGFANNEQRPALFFPLILG